MIFLCSGHQQPTSGAVALIDEVSAAYLLQQCVAAKLRAAGLSVWTDTQDMTLTQVVQHINSSAARGRSCAIELHFNSSSDSTACGTETFIANTHSRLSEVLAKSLTKAVCKSLGTCDRTSGKGWKRESLSARRSLYFCNKTIYPAALLEVCFCSNHSDVALFSNNYDELATSLADTIRLFILT